MIVSFKRLPHSKGLPLPDYADDGAAGMDLRACLDAPRKIWPGERVLIQTGWAINLPEGWEGQIRPRSGLAINQGLTVLNAPGTIDQSYRGEIKIILVNHGEEPVLIEHGHRVAQLVIAPVQRAFAVEAMEIGETARGEHGFGSTGVL